MKKLVLFAISLLFFTNLFVIGSAVEEGGKNQDEINTGTENAEDNSAQASTETKVSNTSMLTLPHHQDESANTMSSTRSSHDQSNLPSKETPSSSNLPVLIGKTEYARKVSLVPVDTKTDYKVDRKTIVSYFAIKGRQKLCETVYEVYEMTNANLNKFVFDLHLYEFELDLGEVHISAAIHCPTKGFPEAYVRIPALASKSEIKLVLVRENIPPERHFLRFESASSITPISSEKNKILTNFQKNLIFGFNPDERWELCNEARRHFRYQLHDPLNKKVNEAAVYEVEIGGEKQLYGAIECAFEPVTMYLCFIGNSSLKISITFFNSIEELIEREMLPMKSDLIGALAKTTL